MAWWQDALVKTLAGDRNISRFTKEDMMRRTGRGGSALQDRMNEGALMADLLGPAAPLATVPVGMAGAGYEGAKWLGQKTGLGKYYPGPFQVNEQSSPADWNNILALLQGFSRQATGQ